MQERRTKASFVNRVVRNLRHNGPGDTARIAWHRIHERFTDWRLGIETRGYIDLELGESCNEYEGTDYQLLHRAFSLLESNSDDVVFLDYGCGKGRTVSVAATRPFKRVIGIDLHEGMLVIARNNLKRMEKRVKCPAIELLKIDATQFEVPDDVNAVFMFNPFGGDILQAVIAQISASLHRRPRTITIFFLYPPDTATDPFEQLNWCSLLTNIKVDRHRSLQFPVYQTCTEDADRPSA